MPFEIAGSGSLLEGAPILVSGRSPTDKHVAFLEGDGDAGYFYVAAIEAQGRRMVGAMRVYVVRPSTEPRRARRADILWSRNGEFTALLIDGAAEALFDVAAGQGYCRLAFPRAIKPLAAADPGLLAALSP